MFTVIIPNSVKKDLKKLDKPLLKKILISSKAFLTIPIKAFL